MYTKVGLIPALYRLSRVSPGISASVEIGESFAADFDWVRISLWISTILIGTGSPSFSLRRYAGNTLQVNCLGFALFNLRVICKYVITFFVK